MSNDYHEKILEKVWSAAVFGLYFYILLKIFPTLSSPLRKFELVFTVYWATFLSVTASSEIILFFFLKLSILFHCRFNDFFLASIFICVSV